jgi:hypothetical protein
MPIGLHHCVDLVETIKMHMWNVQFGVRMMELWSWQEPAMRLTGLTGARSQIRVRSCILMRDLYRFRLLLGQDLPTLY